MYPSGYFFLPSLLPGHVSILLSCVLSTSFKHFQSNTKKIPDLPPVSSCTLRPRHDTRTAGHKPNLLLFVGSRFLGPEFTKDREGTKSSLKVYN